MSKPLHLDYLAYRLGYEVEQEEKPKPHLEPVSARPPRNGGRKRGMALIEAIEKEWVPPEDPLSPPEGWLGVDVGFVYPAVDSDGRIYRWASRRERRNAIFDATVAGPVTVRKPDGRTYEWSAYSHEQLADVKARAETNADEMKTHMVALQVVKAASSTGRGVILENWSDFKKARPAWIRVYQHIRATARKQGVPLRMVNRAYTSQICPQCGHLSRGNRPSRDRFKCLDCGYKAQADHVAAQNLANRAEKGVVVVDSFTCKNKVCSKAPWAKGLCCSCYFYKRRYGLYPTPERLERLQVARNVREFTASLEEVGRPPRRGQKEKGATELAIERRAAERRSEVERLRSRRRTWDDFDEKRERREDQYLDGGG